MRQSTSTETFKLAVDLASRWLGASVIAASDESFGAKENLINPAKADFRPGNYTHSGEIVDGWETRRRRGEAGEDWAIVRLGCPGVVREIDVDTSFFTGNYPEFCRIEACGAEGYLSSTELRSTGAEWIEIVPRSPLQGDCSNLFMVDDRRRYTHVRLAIDPDGGVARLRVKGAPIPDPRFFDGVTIDLASQDNGGIVAGSSDGFYSSATVLNRPDRARNMGEGWETRRRRDDGHDHAIVRLGITGFVRLIEIDATHFKHNASSHAVVSGYEGIDAPSADSADWTALLPRERLQPDTRHTFIVSSSRKAVNWVKLDAFPDGGVSRFRVWGAPETFARKAAGLRWFNSLPADQCRTILTTAGVAAEQAARVEQKRPFNDESIEELLRSTSEAFYHAVSGRLGASGG